MNQINNGNFVLPMVLESNCQTKSGTSRLSPTQPFSERLPTNFRVKTE
ncbi:MAG: hypothetical protein LBL62_03155 [Planctomycetaceae bacterium]|nr:hypothetical protein [Planctomycetaceae bacterium]